jgi:hypothetical protein
MSITIFGGRVKMFKQMAGFGIAAIVLNFAFWGGLIYFVFWCLKHFEIIGG